MSELNKQLLEDVKAEIITAVQAEAIEGAAERVKGEVIPLFDGKFVKMEELKAMLENHKPSPQESVRDTAGEAKYWLDLVSGKATGDIVDTVTGASIVPTLIADKIKDQLQAASYVRSICTVFPDSKGILPVAGGEAVAYRTAEGTAPNAGTPSTLKYVDVSYEGYDLCADTLVSNKLIAKAKPAILDFIYMKLGQSFANSEVKELITGAAASHEFAGLNEAGLTNVTAATGHILITQIDYDDLMDLYHAVPQQYRENPASVFIAHTNFIKTVRKIKDNIGIPIFNPLDNTILNHKFFENTNVSTTGTTNAIAYFGYMKDYYIFDDGQMIMLTTNQGKELTSKRQTYIIAIANTDGKVVDKTGLRGLKLATV